mmetsp:Transcript_20735/g.58647  ORF Transcript_20735/g.58647 Transcript_20735/m.58647 type:complete len:233 (-) Transcript_20735:126-824(-)
MDAAGAMPEGGCGAVPFSGSSGIDTSIGAARFTRGFSSSVSTVMPMAAAYLHASFLCSGCLPRPKHSPFTKALNCLQMPRPELRSVQVLVIHLMHLSWPMRSALPQHICVRIDSPMLITGRPSCTSSSSPRASSSTSTPSSSRYSHASSLSLPSPRHSTLTVLRSQAQLPKLVLRSLHVSIIHLMHLLCLMTFGLLQHIHTRMLSPTDIMGLSSGSETSAATWISPPADCRR